MFHEINCGEQIFAQLLNVLSLVPISVLSDKTTLSCPSCHPFISNGSSCSLGLKEGLPRDQMRGSTMWTIKQLKKYHSFYGVLFWNDDFISCSDTRPRLYLFLKILSFFQQLRIMGVNKKYRKEKEKRKGKSMKLNKEEMGWLTENTRWRWKMLKIMMTRIMVLR